MADQINERDVRAAYRALLHRDPESQEVVDMYVRTGWSLERLLEGFVAENEFWEKAVPPDERTRRFSDFPKHNGIHYSCPSDLRVTETPLDRVLLVGSCLLEGWPGVVAMNGVKCPVDFLNLSSNPPTAPPYPVEHYSFQIGQIPLRLILPDSDYMEWLRAPYGDEAATATLLTGARERLDFWLGHLLIWSSKIPVFVMNFMKPQHDMNGRFFGRQDNSSNLNVIEKINQHLEARLSEMRNVYLLDVDHLSGIYGRRFVQDDAVWFSPHGALISDFDFERDQDRIVKYPRLSAHHTHTDIEFIQQLWVEAEALFRVLRQLDPVKMVCVDLDDTLWRGVLAEQQEIDVPGAIEGWPLGIAEAMLALRRRGIILALISKNDIGRVRDIWPRVFSTRLCLSDFAILKVGWENKAETVRQAMAEANLLPRNVVFLDDNPVERAAVKQAFPSVRVIDTSHYYWRRILLWSPETQGHTITAESTRRSEMIKSQIVRDADRKILSRQDFLTGLNLRLRFHRVSGQDDSRFARTIELLNKTNQFNTTGKRWIASDLHDICASGSVLVCEVSDRHAEYGLVLVGVTSQERLEQVVMSCRVIGMDVEVALVSLLTEELLQRNRSAVAVTTNTDANLLSRDLFERCGWSIVDGRWQTDSVCSWPAHLQVERLVRV